MSFEVQKFDYEYAMDPVSRKSVLLYFSGDGKNCGIAFDAIISKSGEILTSLNPPLRDYGSLVSALPSVAKDRSLTPTRSFVVMELLELYVSGLPIRADGETGIERYYREHPEAA